MLLNKLKQVTYKIINASLSGNTATMGEEDRWRYSGVIQLFSSVMINSQSVALASTYKGLTRNL
jgi:hypothetical protein